MAKLFGKLSLIPKTGKKYTERGRIIMKNTTMTSMATAAVGAAMGAAAVYVATQDKRQMRKTMNKVTRGAEKAMKELDHMISQYTR